MQICQNENYLWDVTHLKIVTPQQSTPGFTRNLEHGHYSSLFFDRN